MVVYCCAFGCKEKLVKGGPISFHGFPKDEQRRKLWVIKLRRKNFEASDHTKICSKHFTPDSFDREKFGGTWLKKTAVPTVFDFPGHSQPKVIERNPPRKSDIQHIIPPLPEPESDGKRKFFIGDFSEEDMASPEKASHVLKMAKFQNENYRRKIKSLSLRNKRLEKRICSLQKMLEEAKKKA